jgi:hypothetical protein
VFAAVQNSDALDDRGLVRKVFRENKQIQPTIKITNDLLLLDIIFGIMLVCCVFNYRVTSHASQSIAVFLLLLALNAFQ